MFGLAQQPGRVIVDPACDIVYFGLRDGFAASAAQLRTLLALARPDDLAAVRRVAVSDALFSLHGAAGGFAGLAPAPSGRTGCPSVRSLAAEILDRMPLPEFSIPSSPHFWRTTTSVSSGFVPSPPPLSSRN